MSDIDRLRSLFETRKRETGLTQSQLAEACGWESQGTVAQYFGKRLPLNLDAAYRLSKALDVPLDAISPRLASKAVELFGATQAAQSSPPQTIEALIALLHDEISSADNDVRLAITQLVKTYEENPAEGAKIAQAILLLAGRS